MKLPKLLPIVAITSVLLIAPKLVLAQQLSFQGRQLKFPADTVNSDSLPRVRFVIMDDYIRQKLASDWDRHLNDHPIKERAYCLRYQLDIWAGEVSYRVTQLADADTVIEADRTGIQFKCNPGVNVAELHVHPDQTCLTDDGPCWPGGPYSHQCIPSDADVRRLEHYGYKFSMVQCARDAEIFYWPGAYR